MSLIGAVCHTFLRNGRTGGNVHKPGKHPEARFVVDTPGGLCADTPKWIEVSDIIILPTKASVRDMRPFLRICEVIRKNIRPGSRAMFFMNMINMRFRATKDYLAWLKTAMDEKRESYTDDYQ